VETLQFFHTGGSTTSARPVRPAFGVVVPVEVVVPVWVVMVVVAAFGDEPLSVAK
jgi:hypothetical protein